VPACEAGAAQGAAPLAIQPSCQDRYFVVLVLPEVVSVLVFLLLCFL
jgi:hypothetical protein